MRKWFVCIGLALSVHVAFADVPFFVFNGIPSSFIYLPASQGACTPNVPKNNQIVYSQPIAYGNTGRSSSGNPQPLFVAENNATESFSCGFTIIPFSPTNAVKFTVTINDGGAVLEQETGQSVATIRLSHVGDGSYQVQYLPVL